MEYIKAEYRRLVRLFCEKYNQIIANDILHTANEKTGNSGIPTSEMVPIIKQHTSETEFDFDVL